MSEAHFTLKITGTHSEALEKMKRKSRLRCMSKGVNRCVKGLTDVIQRVGGEDGSAERARRGTQAKARQRMVKFLGVIIVEMGTASRRPNVSAPLQSYTHTHITHEKYTRRQ